MATPRKPAAFKRLAGNPGRRPIREDFDAGKLERVPSPPAWMGAETKAFYRRAATGSTWVSSPAPMCRRSSRWRFNGGVGSRPSGSSRRAGRSLSRRTAQVVNPWLTVCNRAFDRFVALLSQFGGTPVSRTKLSLDKADPAAFDLREFLMQAIEDQIQGTRTRSRAGLG